MYRRGQVTDGEAELEQLLERVDRSVFGAARRVRAPYDVAGEFDGEGFDANLFETMVTAAITALRRGREGLQEAQQNLLVAKDHLLDNGRDTVWVDRALIRVREAQVKYTKANMRRALERTQEVIRLPSAKQLENNADLLLRIAGIGTTSLRKRRLDLAQMELRLAITRANPSERTRLERRLTQIDKARQDPHLRF